MGKKNRHVVNTEFPLLDELNLYASNTGGDGNCLFRALSDQVYGDESHHSEIRSNVVSYVERHGDHFSAFVGEYGETFEQYIQRLYQDGVYGGHIEIVGFAENYKRQVAIYQADNMYILAPQSVKPSEWSGTAHLAYHTWEHYSSVRPKAGPHSGPVEFPVPEAVRTERSTENPSAGCTDVPPWKVEIVLRSVPDAPEAQVVQMLQTKDLDTVIEELLMQQYDDEPPEKSNGEQPTGDQPTNNEPAESKAVVDEESTRRKNPEEPPEKTEPAAAQASKSSKKQLAKERRQEKKDRARRKKSGVVAQKRDASHSGASNDDETNTTSRVIHI